MFKQGRDDSMTMYRKLLVFAVTLIAAALFAVDYGDRGSWIVCDSDAEGDFDVFYIYPTLVSSAEKPLMDPGDPATAAKARRFTLAQTRELLPKRARLFAPFVRQLENRRCLDELKRGVPPEKGGMKTGIDDTAAAFDHYLRHFNHGRPFILLGHSQGAIDLYCLLRDRREISPAKGFIAAYLPGLPKITAKRFAADFAGRSIHPATGEEDVGAVIVWHTQAPGASDELFAVPGGLCINPLNWSTGREAAGAEKNIESALYDWRTGRFERFSRLCGAAVDPAKGALIAERSGCRRADGSGVLHMDDIWLFSGSISVNILRRAAAWRRYDAAGKNGAVPDEDELAKVKITGTTDKSPLSYRPGETMTFTFRADPGGVPLKGLFLRYHRRGDDGKHASGKVPADQPLIVKTSLDRPGFVNVDVVLADKNDNAMFCRAGSRRIRRPVGFFAGAAVEPEKLRDCGEPADFDAFWARQRRRLDQVPFRENTSVKKVGTVGGVDVFAVSIPCVGRNATGYMTIPAGAAPRSLPIELDFFGYGARRQLPPRSAKKDRIVFSLNAHGQELGREDAYYEKFFRSIRSGKYGYAFDPEQNKDPETAFFNGMALRVMRMLDYLKTRPEWDGKTLRAVSMSQGALQVMWAAALDPAVTYADPSIAWCCDMAGTEKAGRCHGSWRVKYVPALDYYDPVFMAKRIRKATVEIRRVSLGDYTSPPSGITILYNNLATPHKSIRFVQGSDHMFVPDDPETVTWRGAPPRQ